MAPSVDYKVFTACCLVCKSVTFNRTAGAPTSVVIVIQSSARLKNPRLANSPDQRKGSRATVYLATVLLGLRKQKIPPSEGLFERRTTLAYRGVDCSI
jgi:hypothetical protein